jgi:hypothetical protein
MLPLPHDGKAGWFAAVMFAYLVTASRTTSNSSGNRQPSSYYAHIVRAEKAVERIQVNIRELRPGGTNTKVEAVNLAGNRLSFLE